MKITEQILIGVKKALAEGQATVHLLESKEVTEASALTGSGSGKGGKIYFDNAFDQMRYANPFRYLSRQTLIDGTDMTFVAKLGNAADSTNPWGYTVNANSGSPNVSTSTWQLPVRVVSAQLPIRSATLDDINGLEEAVAQDLLDELSELEGQSMATNDDQSGSATDSTGAEEGLRGLTSYARATDAAFGSSGQALTNGIHTIKTITEGAGAIDYDTIADVAGALPPQYWTENTAWHIHPSVITSLRKLKASTGGSPMFTEVGDEDGGAVVRMFGFPVIPNPYLETAGTGNVSIVLADWDKFWAIGDLPEITIKRYDETQPGTVTLYIEKRVVSTVKDPFAGILVQGG
tara:strand:+ start:4833 stop:5876 length:1044 start_codon:yes stop_codon:yes gene_type:complete